MKRRTNVIDLLPGSAQAAAKQVQPDKLPIILSSEEHQITDVVEREVAKLATVYSRNNALVGIIRDDGTGVPKIRRIPKPNLRELITLVVDFVQLNDKGETTKKHPPEWCTSALYDRGEYPHARKLVGILECPALRPDGTVLQTEGYDAATGYVLLPGVVVPPIPECPTQDQAKAALAVLAEPFADFPFATEADRSAVIAVVLTLVARPAIAGAVPAHLADAPTRGSGKTLKHDSVVTIATGRTAPKLSYPGKMEELEKVLAACALEGASVVCFDNVATPFGGGPLDKVLTARDTVKLRVLGKTEVPELAWRAQVLASGNNLEIIGDTSRRCLRSRLESDQENPEMRTGFRHDPLLPWIRENRGQLLCAALTVLRAFVVAGRPAVGTRAWGSFEEWSALIPPAIVYAGGADPMGTRIELEGSADTTKAALAALLAGWGTIDPTGGGVASSQIVKAVQAEDLAELKGILEGLVGRRKDLTASTLGNALRKFRRRVIGGVMLDSEEDAHTKTQIWRVVTAGSAGPAGTSTTQEGKMKIVNMGVGSATLPAGSAVPADGIRSRSGPTCLPSTPEQTDVPWETRL